jgi:hypothetical protein
VLAIMLSGNGYGIYIFWNKKQCNFYVCHFLMNKLIKHFNILLKKTEVTVCSKDFENINIKMDDNALKQEPKFKYLGNTIPPEGIPNLT